MGERSCRSPSLCVHAKTYPEKPCYECQRFGYINLYQPDYWKPRSEVFDTEQKAHDAYLESEVEKLGQDMPSQYYDGPDSRDGMRP